MPATAKIAETHTHWNTLVEKLGGTPLPLADLLPTAAPQADRIAVEHAKVLDVRRNGMRFALAGPLRPEAVNPSPQPQLPMYALYAWTPRCLATTLGDLLDAGAYRVPYAAIAYRTFKPLAWRTQGASSGLGPLGKTGFVVVQCVGGLVAATVRAETLDAHALDDLLHEMELAARLPWRGPSPSDFHAIMEQAPQKRSAAIWTALVVVLAAAVIAGVVAYVRWYRGH